jgi:NAD(P)-dependent dehydrogenase (short-subunit alcohol dehydrogenase family)
MNARFQGKVAIVTGATSGIGREVALRLAAEGAYVALAGRRRELGEDLVAQIRRSGGDAIYVHTDVSRSESIANLVTHLVKHYGGVDLAFNNAGIPGPPLTLTADHTEQVWDTVIATNLKSVWVCMKHEIPQMLKRGGGAIVNNASFLGLTGADFGASAYAASKHGIIGLTKSAAVEYARQCIRVNAVCPGMTRTEMMEPALSVPNSGLNAWVESAVPVGRVASVEEIASAVLWLLSAEASYVTGHALAVDGGILAR